MAKRKCSQACSFILKEERLFYISFFLHLEYSFRFRFCKHYHLHVAGTLLTASCIVTITSHNKTILYVHTNIGTCMGTNCILLQTEVASNVTVHSNEGAISSAIYMGINNFNITELNLPVPHSHL